MRRLPSPGAAAEGQTGAGGRIRPGTLPRLSGNPSPSTSRIPRPCLVTAARTDASGLSAGGPGGGRGSAGGGDSAGDRRFPAACSRVREPARCASARSVSLSLQNHVPGSSCRGPPGHSVRPAPGLLTAVQPAPPSAWPPRPPGQAASQPRSGPAAAVGRTLATGSQARCAGEARVSGDPGERLRPGSHRRGRAPLSGRSRAGPQRERGSRWGRGGRTPSPVSLAVSPCLPALLAASGLISSRPQKEVSVGSREKPLIFHLI